MNGSIFCRNSRKAILNPHQHRSKTEFCQELFARPAFSRKSGQFASAVLRSLLPHTPEEFFGEQTVGDEVKEQSWVFVAGVPPEFEVF